MGIDIGVVIEIRPDSGGRWEVWRFPRNFPLRRDHFAWGCLFDVGRAAGVHHPLFPQRGLPDDVSDAVRKDSIEFCQHSHSYATWAEVAAVDWDAPVFDGPPMYEPHVRWVAKWAPDAGGELVLEEPMTYLEDEIVAAGIDAFGEDSLFPFEWPPGGEFWWNGAVYRPTIPTARMLASPDEDGFAQVWAAMRELAAEHGDENVRLVVSFG